MKKDSPFFLSRVSTPVAGLVALLLALTLVIIDWLTHVDLNISILYGLPLVVTAAARSRRLLWGLALFLLATAFEVYAVQIPRGVFAWHEMHFDNRVLAGIALALTAGLIHVGMVGLDLLDVQRQSLKEHNEELERRRREAEETSHRKSQFLTSVSHDIRTPINAINLMAERLCRTAERPEWAAQVPEVAHRLQANALALAELVGDVLDLARFDAAQITPQMSVFSLNKVLAEACACVLPLAQAKKLWLKHEPPAAALLLRSDRGKLVRIVDNLLANAIKFTTTGGVTVTTTRETDGTVRIGVCDTGVGIAPEQAEHIFDEFVQLQNPGRDRSKGHGLGLAICRRLSEALNGHITVESQPGRGSVFTIRLPASTVVETPIAPAPLDATPDPATVRRTRLAGLHILVVEDDQPTRESLVQIMRDEGAEVREACDGTTARRLLREKPCGALLLDMMLPDCDGREILQDLARHRPPALGPVLVLTGDLTTERQAEVQRLGADSFLAKPVNMARLITLLEKCAAGN